MDRFPFDRLYGIHNWPGLAVGSFATTPSAMMAAGDTWTITPSGTGGHGGAEAHLATDVTVAQARLVTALQTSSAATSGPPAGRGQRPLSRPRRVGVADRAVQARDPRHRRPSVDLAIFC